MANIDTIQAIEDNLLAILVAQGFKIEDLSVDPDMDTTSLVTLIFDGESFEQPIGQKPGYNELRYSIKVRSRASTPATTRKDQRENAHKIRENVSVNTLNVGTLAASLLITRVDHDGYNNDYDPPITRQEYNLNVTYREE